jgi:virulence-associated protein VapD
MKDYYAKETGSYDLGRLALINTFGDHSARYTQLRNIVVNNGFQHIQDSVYRYTDDNGCTLAHAIITVGAISMLPWAGGADAFGNPYITSVRISIQANQFMDVTNFVRGGPVPQIPVNWYVILFYYYICNKIQQV